MKQIGVVLGGPTARGSARAGRQPVRRGSQRRGRCEATLWQGTNRPEVRRALLAAKRLEREGRKPGRRNGPLGHVAIEVLELLGNLVDLRTGRLEPSLAFLMAKLKRSKDALVRALKALRERGLLDWIRRYEETGREGAGPQVRQTSNAYRIRLPTWAKRMLGVQGQNPPLPDDVEQDQADRHEAVEEHKASLPLGELAPFVVEDDALARALAEMGRRLQERESAKQAEIQATPIS